jgi:hypothetical protein
MIWKNEDKKPVYIGINTNLDRITKISNIIGTLKNEYRIVANAIKSL